MMEMLDVSGVSVVKLSDESYATLQSTNTDNAFVKVRISSLAPERLEWNCHGLVQERRNSSALAMELSLSWTNQLILGK